MPDAEHKVIYRAVFESSKFIRDVERTQEALRKARDENNAGLNQSRSATDADTQAIEKNTAATERATRAKTANAKAGSDRVAESTKQNKAFEDEEERHNRRVADIKKRFTAQAGEDPQTANARRIRAMAETVRNNRAIEDENARHAKNMADLQTAQNVQRGKEYWTDRAAREGRAEAGVIEARRVSEARARETLQRETETAEAEHQARLKEIRKSTLVDTSAQDKLLEDEAKTHAENMRQLQPSATAYQPTAAERSRAALADARRSREAYGQYQQPLPAMVQDEAIRENKARDLEAKRQAAEEDRAAKERARAAVERERYINTLARDAQTARTARAKEQERLERDQARELLKLQRDSAREQERTQRSISQVHERALRENAVRDTAAHFNVVNQARQRVAAETRAFNETGNRHSALYLRRVREIQEEFSVHERAAARSVEIERQAARETGDSSGRVYRERVRQIREQDEMLGRSHDDDMRRVHDRERTTTGSLRRISSTKMPGWAGTFDPLIKGFDKVFDALNFWKVVWIGAATAAAPLVSIITALGAAFVALGNYVVSMAGVLAAVPGLFLAIGSAAGALLLAINPVKNAFTAFSNLQKQQVVDSIGQRNEIKALNNARKSEVDALKGLKNAHEAVSDAQEDLIDANKDVKRSEVDLTKAYRDARKEYEALVLAVNGGVVDEKEALDELARAKDDLKRAEAAPSTSYGLDVEEAATRVARAEQTLAEVRDKNKNNAKDLAEYEKKGLEASESVIDAKERLVQSHKGVEDAQQRVIDSQEGVVEAEERVRDAHVATAEAQTALSEASTTAQKKSEQYNDALNKLSPSARAFVEHMTGLKGEFDTMRKTVMESIFKPFVDDLGLIDKMMPNVTRWLSEAGEEVGLFAEKALKMASGPKWTADFDLLSKSNKTVLRNIGDAILYIMDALINIAVAARPFTEWLSGAFAQGMKNFDEWTLKKRNDGGILEFLMKTKERMQDTWYIIKNVGLALWGFFSGSQGLMDWMIDGLKKISDGWRDSGEKASKAGSTYQKKLEDLKPLLSEIKTFIGYVVDGFIGMGSDTTNIDSAISLLESLRTEILPVVAGWLEQLGQSGALENILEAVVVFVDGITKLTDAGVLDGMKTFTSAFKTIFETIVSIYSLPGVSSVIGGIFAVIFVAGGAMLAARLLFVNRLIALATYLVLNRVALMAAAGSLFTGGGVTGARTAYYGAGGAAAGAAGLTSAGTSLTTAATQLQLAARELLLAAQAMLGRTVAPGGVIPGGRTPGGVPPVVGGRTPAVRPPNYRGSHAAPSSTASKFGRGALIITALTAGYVLLSGSEAEASTDDMNPSAVYFYDPSTGLYVSADGSAISPDDYKKLQDKYDKTDRSDKSKISFGRVASWAMTGAAAGSIFPAIGTGAGAAVGATAAMVFDPISALISGKDGARGNWKNWAGALNPVNNAVNQLGESLVTAITKTDFAKDLKESLDGIDMGRWATDLQHSVGGFFAGVVDMFSAHNWKETFGPTFTSMREGVSTFFGGLVDTLSLHNWKEQFGGDFNTIKGAVSGFFGGVVDMFSAHNWSETFGGFFSGLGEKVGGWIGGVKNMFSVDTWGETLGGWIGGLKDKVSGWFSGIGDVFKNSTIGKSVSGAWDSISDFVTGKAQGGWISEPIRRASGGWTSGSGASGYSDDIAALLSRGEFVVNSGRANSGGMGKVLEGINSGMLSVADLYGGLAHSPKAANLGLGSGTAVTTKNVSRNNYFTINNPIAERASDSLTTRIHNATYGGI